MKIRTFCIAALLIVTAVLPSYAQNLSITGGLHWLSASQNTDGSWGTNASTAVVDTAEVINAKMNFGIDASIQNAVAWLTAQEITTVDELSRKVRSLAHVGTDTSSLVAALISANNLENRWGYSADYSSTPIDTAFALQALKSANYTDQAVIFGAINYLLTTQNPDSGWGFTQDDDSNVFVTAQVVSALAQYKATYQTNAQLASAATFLLTKQNPDGGIASGTSTVYESALAFIALIKSGQGQAQPLQNALNYLTTTQSANGSWNNDPYSTALALRALSNIKPDLAIIPVNISVLPSAPTVSNNITVTASVANNGLETAANVTVRLLDNGITVGDQTVAAVNPGASVSAAFVISNLTPAGEHVLSVIVDPANAIDETNKTNNSATLRIWAKAIADLVVLPEFLTISPLYPKPGESITLSAKIANMGESAAGAFAVDLYDGNPNSGGTKLGTFPLPGIAPGEWGTGSFVFSFAAEGQHALNVVVDQLHAVTETSADNNTAQKTVNVSVIGNGFLNDLSIPMNGIQLNPQRPHSGDNVTVTLLAVNLGADTTTATLELFDGDPAAGGTLLHKSVIALSTGETRTVTVPWQMPAGIHTLHAYIDRPNTVLERDKANNNRSLTVMADMVDIEISASDIVIEPEHPMDGDPAAVKITVQNRGISPTGPFNVNLYNGDPNSGGALLQSFAIANLAGDATQTVSYPFNAARGPYRFYAACDSEKVVVELSEDNNIAIRSLLVKTSAEAMGPDLVPLEIDLSAAVTNPQSLRITGTAKVKFQNKGDDKVAAPFRVTVFEDKDGDGVYTEGTDSPLGYWDYSAAMNPNMVVNVTINLDGTLTFRDAPIYAMVDSGQSVYEQNETNNTIRKGSECEARPANPIEPVLKWKWPKTTDTSFGRITSTPVVISLYDDNGDGRIDGRDNPAILVNAANFNTLDGKLWAFDGKSGTPIMIRYVAGQAPYEGGYPIVGDIDGDGKPDILIKSKYGEGILAINNDGTLKWDNSAQVTAFRLAKPGQQINIHESALPVLADLDGDGHSEIIYGATIVNWDGTMRCSPVYPQVGGLGYTNGFSYSISVADLDMDGKQKIIAGNTTYNSDCSIKWRNSSVPDGLTAIGKFDDDPYPKIALLNTQSLPTARLYLLNHDGTVKWGPVNIDLAGGHPVIADFDGDGKPEIGIHGNKKYLIYDGEGRLKMTLPLPMDTAPVDISVAPSVFDLNGDGIPEIFVNTSRYFSIFNGKDGSLLYQEFTGFYGSQNSQNVVVADVDGDGHAEVVITGNYADGNSTGYLRVYGAKNNDWVNTRRIWNQPSYHVTNINDDGSIPKYEAPSWLLNNNYRCQVPTSTGSNPYLAADISASLVRVDMASYPSSVSITARIGNGGAKMVAQGLKTSFHNGDPANGGNLIGTAVTSKILNPGDYEDVTLVWNTPAEGNHTIYIKADSDNTIAECDKTNNTQSYPVYITSIRPDLAINLQINNQRPLNGEMVTVSLLARNIGNAAATADLELFDGAPNAGGIALHTSAVTLNAGETRTVTVPWQIPNGIHTLTAHIDRANVVIERDETNNSQQLSVMADMVDIEVSASDISITPEHPMDSDPATVNLVIQNRGITSTGAFNVNLYNGDPNSGGTLLQSFAITDLAGDATQTISYPFTAARGTYRFYAVCDPENRVAELNEDNNLATRSLLVKTSAEAKGPDLVPLKFDLSGVTTDTQRLRISGTAMVKFQNKGDDKITTPFRITVFEDKDGDGIYTAATDLLLGSWDYSTPMNPNMVGVVSINLSGTVTFRDAPIYAMLDSGQVVFEQNKSNNSIRKGSVCENRPANPIEPVLKWKYPLAPDPNFGRISTTPVVISLTDTNGDGRIDNNDFPAILVNAFASYQTMQGKLWALDGKTGTPVMTRYNTAQAPYESGQPIVGDIDGDGKPEIVIEKRGLSTVRGLLAFSHDGTLKWDNTAQIKAWEQANPFRSTTVSEYHLPVLADLDGDGHTAIIDGRTVFNSDGSVRCAPDFRVPGGTGTTNGFFNSIIVADLDMDGKQEIIAGNTAYNSDCSVKWYNTSLPDGLTAVGNLDDDFFPEIVLMSSAATGQALTGSRLYLLDHDGMVKWGPIYLSQLEGVPSTGYSTHPIIADFDGDGKPEIGIRGANKFFILDRDGRLKMTLTDASGLGGDTSSGPAVFDLDGDGQPEVLLSSGGYFRIFNGKTGALLYQENTGTYPLYNSQDVVIADINGDGHAAAVVVGNNGMSGNLRVYGAKNNDWVNTRRIWNQPSYHATNINDDGSIPKNEAPSWLLNNNYRCQVPTTQNANPYLASDLSASFVRLDMANYPASVTITARIGNGGAKAVSPGLKATFHDGNPANGGVLIATALTTKTVNPGEYEDVTITWNAPLEGNHTIWITANADSVVSECDKANNVATLPVFITSGRPDLSISMEDVITSASIPEGSLANITVTVRNIGTLPANNAVVRLYAGNPASDGKQVGNDQTILTLPAGGTATVMTLWNTLGSKGSTWLYAVVDPNNTIIDMNRSNNTAIREVIVTPAVKPDLQIAAEDISITPAVPSEGDQLTVTVDVHNRGLATGNIKVALYTSNPAGGGKAVATVIIPQIIPTGGTVRTTFTMDTVDLGGTLPLYVKLDPDNTIDESDKTNNQANRSVTITATGLTVTIEPNKSAYSANENVQAAITVTELYGTARTLAYDLLILDGNGVLVATVPESALVLRANAGQSFNVLWNTVTTAAGTYTAVVRIKSNSRIIAKASAWVTITPVKTADARIVVDKISYRANEQVVITATVTGTSPNYFFSDLSAKTSILDSAGKILFTTTRTIPSLISGQRVEQKTWWNTGTFAPGNYSAVIEVKDTAGTQVTTATQAIVISSAIAPSSLLKGTVTVDKQSLLAGEKVNVAFNLTNQGNRSLPNVDLSVLTVHVVNQSVYNTLTYQSSIPMDSSYAATGQIDTTNFTAKDYLVILRANVGGVEETIASSYFRVEGAPSAPALAGPVNGFDVVIFTPLLSVNNASDPNDDKLTYEFELYADSGLTNLAATAGAVTAGQTGITAWTVSAPLTENQVYYWRARAFDDRLYGPWMTPASFRVNTINDPPSAPTISGPVNGSSVAVFTPVLTVNNAADPDSANLTYNFDVALDPDFTHIVSSVKGVAGGQGTTSWQVPVQLVENGWYFWRAQADDWLSVGSWSDTARFRVNTVNDAPTVPLITAPASGSTVTSLAIDIVIANSTDPDSAMLSYYIEVDTVTTFDSPNIIRSTSVPEQQGATLWHVQGLKDNTQYYVRAKAGDGLTDSPWSAVVTFFANTINDPPTTPTLANPSNGAGVNLFKPTLSIHNVTDPDRDVLCYDFELYVDAALTSLITSATGVAETPQTTAWTVPDTLTENRTYYWRARASDGTLQSAWMPIASFMVNTANDAPGAPQLFAPADGKSLATLTPTLTVVNAVDPDSSKLTYDFEIYNNALLVDSIGAVPEGAADLTSVTLAKALSDNTTYSWRARVYDGDRFGPWMNMATFTTHIAQATITTQIEFDPQTLNKKSNGNWVNVKIGLPRGYRAADIDIASIRLEGKVSAELRPTSIQCKSDGDTLMIKFPRNEVIAVLPAGQQVPVHVSGKLATTAFEGVCVIRVIE